MFKKLRFKIYLKIKNYKIKNYTIYPITDPTLSHSGDVLKDIESICKGGAKMVQLREKHTPFEEFLEKAKKAREITNTYGVKLIINDNLRVAFFCKADGLHVGQSDVSIPIARNILGPNAIIGATAKTIEQAQKAIAEGANYLGTGAIFSTSTHETPIIIGCNGYKEVRNFVHWAHRDSIPVIAIGGINESNLDQVLDLHPDGVAMVSAIVGSEDVTERVKNFLERMDTALQNHTL